MYTKWMQVFDTVVVIAAFLFAGFTVFRAYQYHRRVRAWVQKSDAEWKAIQALADDSDRQDEAVQRWIKQTLRKPPKP